MSLAKAVPMAVPLLGLLLSWWPESWRAHAADGEPDRTLVLQQLLLEFEKRHGQQLPAEGEVEALHGLLYVTKAPSAIQPGALVQLEGSRESSRKGSDRQHSSQHCMVHAVTCSHELMVAWRVGQPVCPPTWYWVSDNVVGHKGTALMLNAKRSKQHNNQQAIWSGQCVQPPSEGV
jgi:hypothetical protein